MTREIHRSWRKVLAGLAIAAGLVVPAHAQTRPEQCAAIGSDSERLACYDAVFRPGSEAPPSETLVVESERLIPARPSGRELATMTVSCAEGGPLVSFGFANQLVSNAGDIAPVTFQVDAGGTLVRTLAADESNTLVSFGVGRESNAFLDTLVGGTNLKVRMTPVRQRSVIVDFRLPEIADQIAAIRAACG